MDYRINYSFLWGRFFSGFTSEHSLHLSNTWRRPDLHFTYHPTSQAKLCQSSFSSITILIDAIVKLCFHTTLHTEFNKYHFTRCICVYHVNNLTISSEAPMQYAKNIELSWCKNLLHCAVFEETDFTVSVGCRITYRENQWSFPEYCRASADSYTIVYGRRELQSNPLCSVIRPSRY